MNPRCLKKFFIRMSRDIGFQRFNGNLYDGMRLCHLRIFDEKVVEIEGVERMLNQEVAHSFAEEKVGLEKIKTEAVVRRRRVAWLTNLTSDWESEERTKWREDVPVLPGWKKHSGVKRPGSKTGSKPGKVKRLKLRALKAAAVAPTVKETSGWSPSQPAPGPSQARIELKDLVNGLQQEEGLVDVVILQEDDEVLMEVVE